MCANPNRGTKQLHHLRECGVWCVVCGACVDEEGVKHLSEERQDLGDPGCGVFGNHAAHPFLQLVDVVDAMDNGSGQVIAEVWIYVKLVCHAPWTT